MGIVFGDIGTSPHYTLSVAAKVASPAGTVAPDAVLGIVSLIFWSLIVVISIKYAILIMRADNHGEGGILALLALISPRRARQSRRRAVMVVIGLIGACLLYGDGAITPAISVLSAIEGIKVYAPHLDHAVVPLTILILVSLFLIQSKGTSWIGGLFGPVMLAWFIVIGLLGIVGIVRSPDAALIWSFVVSNYLLGKQPIPFDLLYWNADSTRMPVAMQSFYLRKMYHENRLAVPGGISLAGVAIDLGCIKTPTFLLSTREDHIAPWPSTYAATQLYKGPIKFVLADSGHIAGVISPPGSKYGHWQNPNLPKSAAEWFETASPVRTSWWLTWEDWVSRHAGGSVKAREPGGPLQPIEDAPGSYVRARVQRK